MNKPPNKLSPNTFKISGAIHRNTPGKTMEEIKAAGPTPSKTAKPNKFRFKNLKQKSVEQNPKKNPKLSTRDLLYGSGLTKKAADKAGTDQKTLQSRTYSQADSQADSELGPVIDLEIAPNLIPNDLILDPDQQRAVEGARKQHCCVITGRAGSGKTTTSKAVLSAVLPSIPTIDLNQAKLENNQYPGQRLNVAVCIVSFMGKAIQPIKRALPIELHELCGTIHSTLAYCPEKQEYIDEATGKIATKRVFLPQFTEHNKLPFKLCVIDEGGSVPIQLFNQLVKALPNDCRFIIMGDLNQLPPVTGHSVLGYAITKWPTYVLSKLHRNAGIIAENASRIIDGKKPLQHPDNFIVQNLPDGGIAAFQACVQAIQTLHKNNLFNPLEDAFIVPQNVDVLGQIAFNERLVRYFNPTKKINNIPVNPPIIITAGYVHATYAVGDKIMALANENEKGITNGMTGVIQEILPNELHKGEAIAQNIMDEIEDDMDLLQLDLTNLSEEIETQKNTVEDEEETERQASHTVIVKFQNVDELISFSTAGAFSKITHSYAMTCHKSQGSEYPTVVVLCHSANFRMLYREWLYTAVTRAKTRVILLCNNRGLTRAVNQQKIKGKTIEEKAQKFTALSGKLKTSAENMQNLSEAEQKSLQNNIPMLCAPKEVE